MPEIDDLNVLGLNLSTLEGAHGLTATNRRSLPFGEDRLRDRVDLLIALRDRLSGSDWLRLMGVCWNNLGDTTPYFEALRDLMPKHGPVLEMMDSLEIAYRDRLPDKILAFRGCERGQENECCWATDIAVASMYAICHYESVDPVVVTAWIDKRDILAVRLKGFDQEIIAFRFQVCGIRPADRALAHAAYELRGLQMATFSFEEGTLNDYRQLYDPDWKPKLFPSVEAD